MKGSLEAGRRPHILYGTKENADRWPPLFLPPMLHSTFEEYNPDKGTLTKEEDRHRIRRLSEEARKDVKELARLEGSIPRRGQRQGQVRLRQRQGLRGAVQGGGGTEGRQVYPNGETYDGQFRHDKKHGKGRRVFASCDVYEGSTRTTCRHGKIVKANDDRQGQFRADKHGHGTYAFANGDVYTGEFHKGRSTGTARSRRRRNPRLHLPDPAIEQPGDRRARQRLRGRVAHRPRRRAERPPAAVQGRREPAVRTASRTKDTEPG